MSKKEELLKEKKLKELIDRKCLINRRNCSKAWKGVTLQHFLVMSEILWKAANSGWECFTEVIGANSKWRADLVIISGGVGQIIEILHSESDEKFEKKKNIYPKEFILRKIKTKNFKLNEFDL